MGATAAMGATGAMGAMAQAEEARAGRTATLGMAEAAQQKLLETLGWEATQAVPEAAE